MLWFYSCVVNYGWCAGGGETWHMVYIYPCNYTYTRGGWFLLLWSPGQCCILCKIEFRSCQQLARTASKYIRHQLARTARKYIRHKLARTARKYIRQQLVRTARKYIRQQLARTARKYIRQQLARTA